MPEANDQDKDAALMRDIAAALERGGFTGEVKFDRGLGGSSLTWIGQPGPNDFAIVIGKMDNGVEEPAAPVIDARCAGVLAKLRDVIADYEANGFEMADSFNALGRIARRGETAPKLTWADLKALSECGL